MGVDLRWERLNVIQPPSPTGQFTFSNLFTNLPTDAATAGNTGTPLASFLLGQVQLFSIDLQQEEIRNRAHVSGVLHPGRLAAVGPRHRQCRVRYTLNFPSTEENDQVAVFNLETQQLEYLGRDGQPRAARQLHKLNFGPRLGIVGRITDKTVARIGYGMVWIEMAGITTPFTTPVFPFLQTVSQRTLDNITPAFTLAAGPSVEPIPLTPNAGLGQGVFSVDRDLGSGYVQQWNTSVQRELTSNISMEVAYTGSKITRVGLPDTNLNQLTVEQLALGAIVDRSASRIRSSAPSRARRRSAIRRFRWPSCSNRIRSTRRSASIGTTWARPSITASTPSWSSVSRAGCRISSATRARS